MDTNELTDEGQDGSMMRHSVALLVGFLVGVAIYFLTAFPATLVWGLEGGTWGGTCMLWAVLCGAGGVWLGVWRAT